jgi:glycosyltransferase involved in cell wall biosynthesis
MQTISIGIIGFNEEYGVGKLLNSLREQTLLKLPFQIEIIVISNGSTDRMVAVAKEKLELLLESEVCYQVVELELADKCAAWNHFVHHAASPADFYILLDADVVLVNPSGLEELIAVLVDCPECRICGGKIINQKGKLVDHVVDGKCYAARGDFLRQVSIPTGVVLDDAYILVTLVTNWYETDFETGVQKGYVKRTEQVIVSAGGTPRDRNIRYWLACRKRTITAEYTQRFIDYCMRNILGGGEQAKTIAMQLFQTNPTWFTQFLNQVNFLPSFKPPAIHSLFAFKEYLQWVIYCYSYLLAVKGIRDKEFGHQAWKLKGWFW